MTPSQARAGLLGEHFELRRLIEETRVVLRSSPAPEALRACSDRLADLLLSHSQHEELALRVILKPAHLRPPGRDVMDEHHVAEHARLLSVLRAADAVADALATTEEGIGEALDELEKHMAIEEEALLAEDLLADDP